MSEFDAPNPSTSTSSAGEEHGFVRKDLPMEAAGAFDPAPQTAPQKKKPSGTRKTTAAPGSDEEGILRSAERDDHIEEQLAQIYGNGDGTMPDMRHFVKRKRRTVVTAAVALVFSCLFLGSVAWAGFFFLEPGSGFKEKDVILSVSGDNAVTIGALVTYRIRYRNDQHVPLSHVRLQVRYPEGFAFSESSQPPTNDLKDEWQLGALDAYASGYIDVRGVFYSDIGKKQSLRAFLNYRPANFSSDFQKVAAIDTETTASPFTVTVDGPREAAAGAETALTVTITESGAVSSPTDAMLALDHGGVFTVKGSDPASDQFETYHWTIPDARGAHRVTVRGIFAGSDAVSSSARLLFSVVVKRPGASRGERYVAAAAEYPVSIVHTDLAAHLVINGTASDLTVTPGEMLHASIGLQNTGGVPIKKVRVRALFDSPSYKKKTMLDWTKLEDAANGLVTAEQVNDTMRRGSITWEARQISDLRQLDPGEQLSIDFQVPIKGIDNEELESYPVGDLVSSIDVQYEGGGGKQILSGNTMKLSLVSDASLKVESTALTRADGKETHAITWLLNNSFHPLKDIRFEADLYGDIAWSDAALKVPAGTARYDAGNQRVIWDIPEMPTSVDTFALQFAVTLNTKNPTQTQLSSKVKGSAIDAVTGKEILLVGDEILF